MKAGHYKSPNFRESHQLNYSTDAGNSSFISTESQSSSKSRELKGILKNRQNRPVNFEQSDNSSHRSNSRNRAYQNYRSYNRGYHQSRERSRNFQRDQHHRFNRDQHHPFQKDLRFQTKK